jgi:hypothetical protein
MRAVCLAAILVLMAAATGFAAAPVKGGKYSGTLSGSTSQTVTFKVSKNGKKASGFKLITIPNKCGSGGGVPKQSSSPAAISKGKFTATIRFKTTAGQVFATTTITGKFLKHRRESGNLTTKFKDAASQMCNGKFAYTTKAG